jgi:hypothetical protein
LRIRAIREIYYNIFCTVARVSSPFLDGEISITFYVDTGTTTTSIGEFDAKLHNIDYKRYIEYPIPSKRINVPITNLILPTCSIIFESDTGTDKKDLPFVLLMKSKNQANVLSQVSVLGLDVLINYTIRFENENGLMILEK